MNLTPKQRRFVNEYCVDENATQAAIRAGYSTETSGQMGCENLKKPYIAEAIKERQAELAVAAAITPEWVVSQWAAIARADPRELMQMRRVCCRYCHGVGHMYQWTENEYMGAVNRAIANDATPPDGLGGFGFNPTAEPAADCPECGGEGIEDVYFADTRRLSGDAKVLYAGVKRTRTGMEILTRDKDAALSNLSRYLGMLIEKRELSGPGGSPMAIATFSADDLTDDQLAAIIKMNNATNSD